MPTNRTDSPAVSVSLFIGLISVLFDACVMQPLIINAGGDSTFGDSSVSSRTSWLKLAGSPLSLLSVLLDFRSINLLAFVSRESVTLDLMLLSDDTND